MKILVTGAAGFIGSAVSQRLCDLGYQVLGIDNLNDYYDVRLKHERLRRLRRNAGFCFEKVDIANRVEFHRAYKTFFPDRVIHLAAQAGVRHSLTHPHVYGESNIVGFLNVLEECRHSRVDHLVYASSSSVYGANGKLPFSVRDEVNHPLSLYAATKRANELMAHSYSHLYRLPTTGLRLFSAYGPWGRPDMALSIFTKRILNAEPIELFNHGNHRRDFTYIDDIAEAIEIVSKHPPVPAPDWSNCSGDPARSAAPFRIYNVGNHDPVSLGRFVELLENALGRKAIKELRPMAPGDVPESSADTEALARDTGFRPKVSLEVGIGRFVAWYQEYYAEPAPTKTAEPPTACV